MKPTCCRFPLRSALVASLLALAVASPLRAQTAHEHAHAEGGPAVAAMTLDDGQRWATDAALRDGMAGIRKAFDAHHAAIHDGSETDAQYGELAAAIEAQVNAIVANCKLPAAADANLHYAIADLMSGVALMRGQDASRSRHDGAVLVNGALKAYGKFFDDPQWQP